ncbi:MAG: alpha/beta hydrolase [Saprospiraceae bacterium]|nr:alpha/beta hydrolase [Saprospiraceae bacterium]
MNKLKNEIVEGKYGKPVSLDIYWKDSTDQPQEIVLFAHGFKGFKDWGHWEKLGEALVEAGYCFIKFNFSHNGTTPVDPLNFTDLEAFGQNNYTKELSDLEVVLDWISQNRTLQKKTQWQTDKINLIGHSRGGPIVLIKAKEDNRVKKVITWAAVHELDYAWKTAEHIHQWKKEGVYYILNGRTKQEMPLYYQLYEDYQTNKARFSITTVLEGLDKPYLILHGTADPAVPTSSAEYLYEHANAKLTEKYFIDGANHVFGGSHPFTERELSKDSQKLLEHTIRFLKS